jgi:hypothetical protein
MPGNPNGVMLRAKVMFSRSIPENEIEALYKKYLFVDQPDANVLQNWYPAIWRRSPSGHVQSSRPTLEAAAKTFDVPLTDGNLNVRFDSIHPEFADEYGGKNRWANIMRLSGWGINHQIATALPTEYRDPKFSPFRVGGDIFLATTEGLVQFPKYRDMPHYWELRDGMSAVRDWLNTFKIEVKLSDAGRATQQIIQTLGGFGGVRNIAHADIVKLLNEIARKPTTKSMQHQEFVSKINVILKGDIWRQDAAKSLVEKNAVELGLELRCSKCSSWSWYSLNQLDYKVNCSLCLREFGFPIIEPSNKNNSRWAYRLIGPFALPDYASGGYAASLAIRFFAGVLGGHDSSDVTWSSGQELTFPDGKKIESDFILWYQRKALFGNNHPTDVVFGEAKSFGRSDSKPPSYGRKKLKKEDVFREEDVTRMKILAEAFPGAVLVFATMKEAGDMSKDELARIRKLAEWGREYVKESRRSRAPGILLTGTELFAGYSLSTTWKAMGGKHEELSSFGYIRLNNLRVLADLTQQLYLRMPSYIDWAEKKWKARRERKEKSTQKTS